MRVTANEHHYVLQGRPEEIRQFKQDMLDKYEQVDVYHTPYDARVVCKYLKPILVVIKDDVVIDVENLPHQAIYQLKELS